MSREREDLTHGVLAAMDQLMLAIESKVMFEEKAGPSESPSFKTLLARIPDEELETLFEDIDDSLTRYHSRFG